MSRGCRKKVEDTKKAFIIQNSNYRQLHGQTILPMHGRLKVKTTAEQQEAKRKEREKKLKIYTAATQASFKKRNAGEFDEEALKITGELLTVNPDFYTLWNYRKEIFLYLKDNRSSEELDKLMNEELWFLESCLKVNPKSYGTWHHRTFIMENIPNPDWNRELQLCNTFLEYDERNFHCWDYRRFVVLMSDEDLEAELNYTTQKIQSNFSNYSSWHYRSKLLPMIHPDPTHPVRVQEDVLLKEYETVQNAIFTDPDDQSAWFYHRWLLGRGRKKLQISGAHISRETKRITVLLTSPIKVGHGHNLSLIINSTGISGKWHTVKGTQSYSVLWVMDLTPDLPADADISVTVTLTSDADCTQFSQGFNLAAHQEDGWVMAEYKLGSRFSAELSAATLNTLETELGSIEELRTLESENKWVLLTLLSLMKAIDPRHDKYEGEMTECIDKLVSVDPKRKAYYKDLRSKYVIESVLDSHESSARKMSVCNRGLTCLYYTEWMILITDLDLSQNSLSDVNSLSNLQCLQCLNLDNNLLSDVQGLQYCIQLKDLSIKKNSLAAVSVLSILKSCTSLKRLCVVGNPLCKENDYSGKIQEILPSVTGLNDQKDLVT